MEPAGSIHKNGTGGKYIPKCMWLNADHNNGDASAAMKFDVSAYGDHLKDTVGKDACAPTIYGPDDGPINDRSSFVHFRYIRKLKLNCSSAGCR